MEITHFTVYLITRLNIILSVFIATAVLSGIGTVVTTLIFLEDGEFKESQLKLVKTVMRVSIIILSTSVPVICHTPTKKDIAAIYLLPKIVNSEMVQEVPSELTNLLKLWID